MRLDSFGFGGHVLETGIWYSEAHAGHTLRFHNNESELAAMILIIRHVIQLHGRCQTSVITGTLNKPSEFNL